MNQLNQDNHNAELDEIMEDLIVGHNFEYARTALLAWNARQCLKVELSMAEEALWLTGKELKPKTLAMLRGRIERLKARLQATQQDQEKAS